MIKRQGCFTVVINEENKVLLVKRKDFPIWDLPGGRLEKGESQEECAIRETLEETGYNIKIKRKIGEYDRPQFNDMQHVFLGQIVGGTPIKTGTETSKLQWFPPKKLPLLLISDRRKQISDYLNHDYPVNKTLTETEQYISILRFLKGLKKKKVSKQG